MFINNINVIYKYKYVYLFYKNMQKNNTINFNEVFSKIYQQHAWGNGSGPGSAAENTKSYRTLLQYF